jgi:hypothetical protein
MKTKKTKLSFKERRRLAAIGAIIGLSIAGVGCGRNLSGTYVGTENVIQNGMATQASQVTVVINQMDGDNISGYWQGSTGMGMLSGRANGDRIDSVSLNVQSQYGGMYPQQGGCGAFTGTLFVAGGTLSGMLMSNTQAAQPDPNNPYSGGGYGCQGSRTVQASLNH